MLAVLLAACGGQQPAAPRQSPQPVGISRITVDGQDATGTITSGPRPQVVVTFVSPMKPSTVRVSLAGTAATGQWAPDGRTLTLAPVSLTPYAPTTLDIAAGAMTSGGQALPPGTKLTINPVPVEPANSGNGINPGFKPVAPVMIVVENSGPARPQTGLQQADIVFEYISEYHITRMTAVYFNQVPKLVGPVRSCRMVNAYLDYAFDGLHMCSGASVGTLHWLFGNGQGAPIAPGTINDFDQGNHFFRSSSHYAPHDVFTSDDRALRLRTEWNRPAPDYRVDSPHPDSGLGTATDPPAVSMDTMPGDGITYAYDPAAQVYLRSEGGTAFNMSDTGQLRVKNVVVMSVPCHDAGWIEDENGGAKSVWYDLLNGGGEADIYSDGKVVHGRWQMGPGSGTPDQYWKNNRPMYFTDASGAFLELNTGLTWVHMAPTCSVYNST